MNVFNLFATLGLDSSNYEKGLAGSESKFTTFGSKLKKGFSAATRATGLALTAATTAIAGFGRASVTTGKEFEVAMSSIAAALGLTTADIANNVNGAGDTFNALKDKAEEMGRITNFSATQAAEGLQILALSGYDANKSIAIVEDVLHLAAAGSISLANAASYVTGTIKGFNDETKDSRYYADLMSRGATLAATTVAQLGEAMSSGAASAAAYGQTADSMTVSLLRLAEQGEVGAAAGTALAAAMKNIYSPTNQAKKALDELGVSAYSSTGEARDFNDIVNELSEALSGFTDEQRAAYKETIFGIQGLSAYNKMTVTGVQKQKEWTAALKKASDGMGEAAKQYATMTDNLQGDLDKWNSAVEAFKITVYDQITPALREFTQFGADAISNITTAFKAGGLEAAVKTAGRELSNGLKKLATDLPDIAKAGAALVTSLIDGMLEDPEQIVTAGVDLFATLLNATSDIVQKLSDKIPELISGIVSALTNEDAMQDMVDGGVNLFVGLVSNIPAIISGIADALPKVLSGIAEALTNEENLQKIAEAGEALFNGLLNNLGEIIQSVGESASALISGLLGLGSISPGVTTAVLSVVAAVAGYKLVVSALPALQAAVTLAQSAMNTVMSLNPIGLVVAAVSALTVGFITLWNTSEGFRNFWIGLWNTIRSAAESVSNWFRETWQGIANWFSNLWEKLRDTFKNLWKKIGDGIVGGLWSGIHEKADWLWDKVSGWISGLWNGIKGFFGIHSPSTLFRDELGKNLILGLGNSFSRYGDIAVNAATDFSGRIADAASFDVDAADYTLSGTATSGRVTVNNYIYAQAMSPAEIFEETREKQETALFLGGIS